MASIYDIISATPDGGTAALPPGEFEGPVVIGRPMTLRGSNTTVWARHGAVIDVQSPGVTLEGLRVEITEGELTESAITAAFPTAAQNVEVLGTVSGFGAEDGEAAIPRTLALGELSTQEDSSFLMTVDIPAEARIVCSQGGLTFQPEMLPAGRSEVRISVAAPGTPGLVYTEILLDSQFRRRIYLSGRFTAGAPAACDRVIFTAGNVVRTPHKPAAPEQPKSICAPSTPVYIPGADIQQVSVTPAPSFPAGNAGNPGSGAERSTGSTAERGKLLGELATALNAVSEGKAPLKMARGQRIPAAPLGDRFEVYLTGVKLGELDIDPYVFLLDGNERSIGDGGLVFFGNVQSPDGAVRYDTEDGHVTVEPGRLSPEVKRVVIAYSVYSGDARRNFALVRDPIMSLYSGGRECVSFPMDGLTNEITIVAMEMYIYKGEWRISSVGSGYRDGLVKLCNRYGIEVSS